MLDLVRSALCTYSGHIYSAYVHIYHMSLHKTCRIRDIHVLSYINLVYIRELVDSVCRDGADMPKAAVHRKSLPSVYMCSQACDA